MVNNSRFLPGLSWHGTAWFGLGLALAPIMVFIPNAILVYLALITLLVLSPWFWPLALPPSPGLDYPLPLLLLCAILWLALGLFWSVTPMRSLTKIMELLPLCGLAILALAGGYYRRLPDSYLKGILLALVLAAAYVLLDITLNQLIVFFQAKKATLDAGYNRFMTIMALLIWPLLFALPSRWRCFALLFGLLLIINGQSAAATLGIVAGSIVWLLYQAGYQFLARTLLLLAIIGSFALMPMLVLMADLTGIKDIIALPFSAQHRLEIWHKVVDVALESPLLGYGLDSSRHFLAAAGAAQ